MNRVQYQPYIIALLAAALSTQVYAESWQSAQDESQLQFIASYEGAEAPGQFRKFAVSMTFDPLSLFTSSILVDVDMASASMDNAEIDEAIAEPEWFNALAFPHAVFRSEKISTVGDSEYVAEGIVSIKGVDKPVTVPFHWQSDEQNAEMTGSITLSRTDFGIGSGEWESESSIGHTVQVRFKVVLDVEE